MVQQLGRFMGLGLSLVAVLAAVLILLPVASSGAQPLPPNRFFGRATLDGAPAAGAAIAASVGTATCGSATADASGNYRLDVVSSGERPGCGTDGATVTFTVSGARASQTATWRQGEFTQLDLTAARAPAPAPPPPPAPPAPPAPPPPAVVTPTPAVRVPVTGTGGGESGTAWLVLALAGLAVVGVGSVLAVRRLRG